MNINLPEKGLDRAIIIGYIIMPILCWVLPFLFGYLLPLAWWQGGMIGYLGSVIVSSAGFALFQLPTGGPTLRALKLGIEWPYSTLLMGDPIALSIALE